MSSRLPKLGVALREGLLIGIGEADSGLGCGCVCPACGARLVARKGSTRVSHFAHHEGASCEYGAEAVAVQLAHRLLSESRRLTVPPVYALPHQLLRPVTTLELTELVVGNAFDSPIPDVLVRDSEGKPLLVQVRITHATEARKIIALGEEGVSAIELQVPRCEIVTFDAIRKAVVGHVSNKLWLFNREAALARFRGRLGCDGPGQQCQADPDYSAYFPRGLGVGSRAFAWLPTAANMLVQ